MAYSGLWSVIVRGHIPVRHCAIPTFGDINRIKGNKMTGCHWTDEEIRYLKENYGNKTGIDIAKKLGKSLHSVYVKACRMDLIHPKGIWTNEEVKFLKKNYRQMSFKQIGTKLKKSKSSIQAKIHSLGLRKLRKWTEREDKFLKENYIKMTLKEIAKHIEMSIPTIRKKERKLGLRRYWKGLGKPFDSTPSPTLAYVIGVCQGDGTICKSGRHYVVQLGVKDKCFAESFRVALSKIGLSPSRIYPYQPSGNRSRMYVVMASSKPLYEWFHNLAVDKIEEFLESKEMKEEYIRGLYESEGSFSVRGKHQWDLTICCSTNRKLLEFLQKVAEALGFSTKISKEMVSKLRGRIIKSFNLRLMGGTEMIKEFLRRIEPCIPRKSLRAVKPEDLELKQPHRSWTEKELEFLKEKYPRRDVQIKDISSKLERSEGTIKEKARSIRLRRPYEWAQKELEYLKQNYSGTATKKIANKLRRSVLAVRSKAQQLGLHKARYWTEEELEYLKQNYPKIPARGVAKKLGRSRSGVKHKAHRLGLKLRAVRKWTEEELEYLKRNYLKIPAKEIAAKLGRNEHAIISMAYLRGLGRKLGKTHPLTS